jgi:hypothetical protein
MKNLLLEKYSSVPLSKTFFTSNANKMVTRPYTCGGQCGGRKGTTSKRKEL